MRAFAELNEEQTRIEVRFPYDEAKKDAVKALGARWIPREKGGPAWSCPLELEVGRSLRRIFGQDLQLGVGVKAWGNDERQRQRNLGSMARADDWELANMAIARGNPELGKYLRPYQRADVALMAENNVLNGNEMGLGKTVEVLAAIWEAGLQFGPHLIIGPKTSLAGVWKKEIAAWFPTAEIITWSGDLKPKLRGEAVTRFHNAVSAGRPAFFVCTPTAVRTGLPVDVKTWNTVTVDEFHKAGLTNASGDPSKGSQFARVMRGIKAVRKFALSGTPMGGKPIKLWGVLHWLHPDKFASKWRWANQWLQVTTDDSGHKEIGQLDPEREDDFYAQHAHYMVRRLKREVMPQLPKKIYEEVWVGMSVAQRKAYDEFAKNAEIMIDEQRLSANGVLAEYARLKQFANARCRLERKADGTPMVIPTDDSQKLPALLEKLDEQGIRPGDDAVFGEMALVGSESARMVEMVAAWLEGKGLYVEVITGKTHADDRERIQDISRDPKTRPQVIVMTTTAGGMSINLQEANSVHILDETWNPDDQVQLEDRADRGSRTTPLLVIYYRAEETVQEYIYQLTQSKAATNKQILDFLRNKYRKAA